MMAGGPISWSLELLHTEAEYVAAAEAVWIRHFLFAIRKRNIKPTNLTFKEPTQLGIDNQACQSQTYPCSILIRDFIEHGEIKALYVPTTKMIANGLTKAAKPDLMERMVKALRLEG